jgi:hypothetical protein
MRRGAAATTDLTSGLANTLSGPTALALIVTSFVAMAPKLFLAQCADSIRQALTANRRAAESLEFTIP